MATKSFDQSWQLAARTLKNNVQDNVVVGRTIGKQAVVIGAGMSGLAADVQRHDPAHGAAE